MNIVKCIFELLKLLKQPEHYSTHFLNDNKSSVHTDE